MPFNKIFKKIIVIVLIFIISVNNFAAVVSDNDGSAFITKAEFDSLKNNFQAQIDQYNTSIDNKIDGAIAAYLVGIRLSKETELTLDRNCNYSFPLCNDINGYWSNYTINGGKLMYPEFHYTNYIVLLFGVMGLAGVSYRDNAAWVNGNVETGMVSTAGNKTTLPTDTNQQNGGYQLDERNYDYGGKNGLLNIVEETTNTRNINGNTYGVYSLEDEGVGRLVLTYQSEVADVGTRESTMWNNGSGYTTGHSCFFGLADEQYVYTGSGTSIRYAHRDPAGSFTPYKVTKSRLVTPGSAWGNQLNYSIVFPNGAELTASEIGRREFSNRGSAILTHYNFWSKAPIAEAVNYVKSNARTHIYTRNQFMPANSNYDYALTADLQKGTDIIYTIVGGGENVLTSFALWSVNEKNIYAKPLIQPLALPPLKPYKWHSASKYAPSEDEEFSYLPATLVTYTDSNGKTHYMDEGMFLGTLKQNGNLQFDVLFQRDYGSGSKVELHISKKPFSYDCQESDLVNYKIGDVTGKKQQLDYGTKYTIKIEDAIKNDDYYLEWVPVNSEDLSSMTSFTNFVLISDD